MRLRPFLPILSLGLVALLAGGCAPDGNGDAMPEGEAAAASAAAEADALDALRARWVEQYNLHQPDAVAELYTDSAWILNADMRVDEGRAAVAEAHRNAMASSPTASVATTDRIVFGDQAVAWGPYEVEAQMTEGQPTTWSGTWLGYFRQVDGEWKIDGMLTNYDAPPPEGWMWGEPPADTPPEESTMVDLIGRYEAAFNAQDARAVADMYTEDATVAFSFAPPVQGSDAVAADLESRWAAQAAVIDVHGVGTMDLDENHKLDGGWYELTDPASGQVVQTGMYLSLVERTEDGAWKIRWGVTNGRPAAPAAATASGP